MRFWRFRGAVLVAAVILSLCASGGSAAAASGSGSAPDTAVGPPGCTGTWYSYDVIASAFGVSTALTDAEYSDYHTDVYVGVSSMDTSYNNEIYAQATNSMGFKLSAYEPIAEFGNYTLWYNDYGGLDVRVGFSGQHSVIYRVEVTGLWSPNTDC